MKSLNGWVLKPWNSFGEIPLENGDALERYDFEDLFGDPVRDEHSEAGITYGFRVEQGELLALFSGGLSFEALVLPTKEIVIEPCGSEPVTLTDLRERLRSYDPDAQEITWRSGLTLFVSPKLGVSIDMHLQKILIHTKEIRNYCELPKRKVEEVVESSPLSAEAFNLKLHQLTRAGEIPSTAGFVPIFGESSTSSSNSYGGFPLLQPDERWPVCQNCTAPMAIKLQIDLTTLPDEIRHLVIGEGLLQIFHCMEDECLSLLGEEDEGFAYLVRIIPVAVAKTLKQGLKTRRPVLRKQDIVSFKRIDDHPSLESMYLEGRNMSATTSADSEFEDAYSRSYPSGEDKLGGFPAWIQSPELPRCDLCRGSSHFKFILQFNSGKEDEDLAFGDAGCAYLFQCVQHPEVLALVMQTC